MKRNFWAKNNETTKYPIGIASLSQEQWRSKKYKKGGGHNFHIFSNFFFRQNKFEADLKTRKAPGGTGTCSLGKIFESLYAVMAILVLFE